MKLRPAVVTLMQPYGPSQFMLRGINNIRLDEVEEIKDLGVIYDSLLLFDKHISEKAYMMLGIIKRNFEHITRNCFVTLYKSLVKSHLEYANTK